MNTCLYCGIAMLNPRRVQCGAPSCARARTSDRVKATYERYRQRTGEAYQSRYSTEHECIDCGEVRRVRVSSSAVRCISCQRRLAAKASGLRTSTEAATPEAEDRRKAARAQRKAVRRSAESAGPPFSPQEIFERDGWRCGICQRKVRKSLKWPHPFSPSLDHIVAIAAGGSHSRDNVQCSHLRCNISKNSKGAGQLLMFG